MISMLRSKSLLSVLAVTLLGLSVSGCRNPQPGPDKTLAGAVLGAGWGAGAGAVVGNQIDRAGEGAAVGSGLGAAQGMLIGAGFDVQEGAMLDEERKLASLNIQNLANGRQLEQLQEKLDRAISSGAAGGVYQVFFDTDQTNLRSGATANLEVVANSILSSPYAHVVQVVGHSDDSGTPDYNERLAEARARAVSGYLMARGMSADQVRVSSFGSQRPIATNTTETGRQLNRRVDIYISH